MFTPPDGGDLNLTHVGRGLVNEHQHRGGGDHTDNVGWVRGQVGPGQRDRPFRRPPVWAHAAHDAHDPITLIPFELGRILCHGFPSTVDSESRRASRKCARRDRAGYSAWSTMTRVNGGDWPFLALAASMILMTTGHAPISDWRLT